MFPSRKSRKQFHRYGHSLAPDESVAGKAVGTLRRFVPAFFPPVRELEGRTVRGTGSFAPDESVAGKEVGTLRRFVPASMPPVEELEGRVVRGVGYFDTTPFWRCPTFFPRFVPAQFPPVRFLEGRTRRGLAKPPEWLKYGQTFRDACRVADTAQALYELYVGEDAVPDFTGAADETSATLPFSHVITPPVAGTTVFHAACRQRNQYGIVSMNQFASQFEVDDNGDLVVADPSGPEDVELIDAKLGKAVLFATYYYRSDGDDAADTWQIYSTTTGVDPVPGVDTPTEQTMLKSLSDERLHLSLGPYASASDLRVILRAKRSADDATDGNTTVFSLTTVTFPDAPTVGGTFGGSVYESK